MPFSKAILVKGLGGAALVGSGGAGIVGTREYLNNQTTKYDDALIDFLNAEGKIQFSVKEGNNDISDSFPSFDSSSSTAKITIKVTTTTSGTEGILEGKTGATEGGKGTVDTLKELNKVSGESKDWTWTCELEFKRPENETNNTLADKDALYKTSSPEGFLNKLAKKENEKELKIQFIKNCAKERGFIANRKINKEDGSDGKTITSLKTFELVKGDSNLKFKNQNEFNAWFGVTS